MLASLLALAGCTRTASSPAPPDWDEPELPFQPSTFVAYRAPTSLHVDGRLDEGAWQQAPWTDPFVDSRGRDRPAPPLQTRAKMLWDDTYLYLAAKLEEPHVRAGFTTRDTSVWRENAFEIFIDPTGSTHNYYELQVNARETRWDLLLTKPYRDEGTPISAWDIRGLKKAVSVQGTLNDPSDEDEGWTVELAVPWDVLAEAAPGGQRPGDGDRWRFNLTRVQWSHTVEDGQYVQDSTDNWSAAWTPQEGGNFHQPERWGIVRFSDAEVGADAETAEVSANDRVTWALRRLYYRQQQFYEAHDRYATSLSQLETADISPNGVSFDPTLQATQSMYEITAVGTDGTTFHIRQDGKVWSTP